MSNGETKNGGNGGLDRKDTFSSITRMLEDDTFCILQLFNHF